MASKKITDLTEATQPNDYEESYFVVANKNINKRIAYNTLKDSILKGTGVEKYTPS
jgi:hypothetical protein